MSSYNPRVPARVFLLLLCLLTSTMARTMRIPQTFNPEAAHLLHSKRAAATCGGDKSLQQCQGDFPPNFCCPSQTTCLSIDTGNSSVTSAICCPVGQNCDTISPISCRVVAQDATKFPRSMVHAIPPQSLDKCGTDCCPMGYSCKNGQCAANVPLSPVAASQPSSITSTPHSQPTATGESTAAPVTSPSHPLGASKNASSSVSFSGASFAAGFVPGIAIGVIVAALVVFLCLSKKRKKSATHDEKQRDTLTDLGTLRPTMHGRSISEPTMDPASVTRTDFLRSPPRTADSNDVLFDNPFDTNAAAPKTPPNPNRTPRVKALFSRSPFLQQTPPSPSLTQPPIPAHLKRGTLSYAVSPIRALRKQKSTHSLRRQMTDSARYPGAGRTQSTETIQVLLPPNHNDPYTPDPPRPRPETNNATLASATYQPPRAAWGQGPVSPIATAPQPQPQQQSRLPWTSSSRYPSEMPQLRIPSPPPPLPVHGGEGSGMGFLDSPYTPTKTPGLAVPGAGGVCGGRRETTFSSLMEKAGLRKSELVMGTKKKIDARFGL